ncbi:MAG: hypothetical protein HDR00_08375 [Lachnospiraceae bacterium]|nr:hypothetical protein [Lachnospiraceae bacterium]
MESRIRKLKGGLKKGYTAGIVVCLSFLMLIMTGCGLSAGSRLGENSEQAEEYEEKAKEIMTEYLANNLPDAEITECGCWSFTEESSIYITDYVDGTFQIGEDSYKYYVNVYTGEVYTTYYQNEISNRLVSLICEKLGIENYEIEFQPSDYGNVISKTVPVTENEELKCYGTDKTLQVPVRGDITEDELDEFAAELLAGNGYKADFIIVYDDDIRIEDMDFNQLNEEFQGVDFYLYHRRKGAGLDIETEIGNLESLSFIMNQAYSYRSYNIVEMDEVFLVYEEYSDTGSEDVQINVADEIKPDNFSIVKDEKKIDIRLKEPAEYYICLSDTDFLNTLNLYYDNPDNGGILSDKDTEYLAAGLVEDRGMGYDAVCVSKEGELLYDQDETFYIGKPSREED